MRMYPETKWIAFMLALLLSVTGGYQVYLRESSRDALVELGATSGAILLLALILGLCCRRDLAQVVVLALCGATILCLLLIDKKLDGAFIVGANALVFLCGGEIIERVGRRPKGEETERNKDGSC